MAKISSISRLLRTPENRSRLFASCVHFRAHRFILPFLEDEKHFIPDLRKSTISRDGGRFSSTSLGVVRPGHVFPSDCAQAGDHPAHPHSKPPKIYGCFRSSFSNRWASSKEPTSARICGGETRISLFSASGNNPSDSKNRLMKFIRG